MIKFYGSPMSSATRSRWMLEETGVKYDYVVVNVREGGTRTPEFLARNPGGKIPFLEDGDVKLFESMAINFYLAEKYAPELWASDPYERAQIHQWSLWAATNLQPQALTVMHNTMLLPEPERNAKLIEPAKQECQRFLGVLEELMSGDYLVGNRFTVADVNAGSITMLALRIGAATAGPKVATWSKRLHERKALQTATSS
jgi:glutathione S-transferase